VTETRPMLLTPGEPAGIGPELALHAARRYRNLVLVADPDLIARCARRIGQRAPIAPWPPGQSLVADRINVLPVRMAVEEQPGRPDSANADYVLATLESACQVLSDDHADALVTGPIHKAAIIDAGHGDFRGHTEFLARLSNTPRVVMMLAAGKLRVALATTHLPLAEVPGAINADMLGQTLDILHHDLVRRFGIDRPHIAVLGLNPHAGESGHLGREEIDIIEPVLEEKRAAGMRLGGPLPADTAFLPERLERFDAVLAMYHDQGLPVLKHAGFGRAVNITLGLPFIRTSVDHGTALDLAGTGQANADSLIEAVRIASRLRG